MDFLTIIMSIINNLNIHNIICQVCANKSEKIIERGKRFELIRETLIKTTSLIRKAKIKKTDPSKGWQG